MTRLEEMKKLATEEAVKLKKHATKNEIAKLDLGSLDSNDTRQCIYGQMTGNCNTERAQTLIILCCNKVYNAEKAHNDISAEAPLNGKPYLTGRHVSRSDKYQSPIEMLIYGDNGGIEAQSKLISFLKDETQTLEL